MPSVWPILVIVGIIARLDISMEQVTVNITINPGVEPGTKFSVNCSASKISPNVTVNGISLSFRNLTHGKFAETNTSTTKPVGIKFDDNFTIPTLKGGVNAPNSYLSARFDNHADICLYVGLYACRIEDSNGYVYESSKRYEVFEKPKLTVVNTTNYVGDNVTLSCPAEPTCPSQTSVHDTNIMFYIKRGSSNRQLMNVSYVTLDAAMIEKRFSFQCESASSNGNISILPQVSDWVQIWTVPTLDNRSCDSSMECYAEEVCLLDCYVDDTEYLTNLTHINKTCSCNYTHYHNHASYTCSPTVEVSPLHESLLPKIELAYDKECDTDDRCLTSLARCLVDTTGTKRCKCPDGQFYDAENNMCTNFEICPNDNTYAYYKEENLCHKVININETCDNDTGAVDLKLDKVALKHFVETLWRYGYYGVVEGQNLTSTVLIQLSTNHTVTAGKTSEWFWSDGDRIRLEEFGAMYQAAHLSEDSSNSCLSLLYNGSKSTIRAYEPCDMPSMFKGCVISLPLKFCEENKDTYGFVWNFTEGGKVLHTSCRDGYKGLVTRKCTKLGEYKLPFYNCTLDILNDIGEELDNGTISSENAVDQLSELTDNLTDTTKTPVYIGDLLKFASILDKAAGSLTQNITNATATAYNFLNVANFLVDPERNGPKWESRIQTEQQGAEQFLNTVDKYVSAFVSLLSANETDLGLISKPNLALQFGVVKNESDIEFPPGGFTWPNTSTSSLFLKIDALKDVKVVTSSKSFAGLLYKDLSKAIPQRLETNDSKDVSKYDTETTNYINSQVISLQLFPETPKILTPSLIIKFHVFNETLTTQAYVQNCAFWDSKALNGTGAWSTDGCVKTFSNQTLTLCECNHLTNFALLISPAHPPPETEKILILLSYIGCGVSMLFLVITLVLNAMFWKFMKSDTNLLTVILCVLLLLGYVVFIAGVTQTSPKALCTSIAALLHYIYLAVFFIMLAEGLVVFIAVAFPLHKKTYINQFLCMVFAVPAVIVGISLGVTQLEGYGNDKFCWLSVESGLLWAFVGPASFVILVNTVIICFVLRKLHGTAALRDKSEKEKAKASARMVAVLLPILGCTWVFGVFSVNRDTSNIFQPVFVALNSLQGVAIFIFHALTNKQLRIAIRVSKERRRTKEEFTSELKHRLAAGAFKNTTLTHREEPSCVTRDDDEGSKCDSNYTLDRSECDTNGTRGINSDLRTTTFTLGEEASRVYSDTRYDDDGATCDRKDTREGSTYDPKGALEGSNYDPKDALEGATYDPKGALEGSTYDPKGILEGSTSYDPKDALEEATCDPKDALEEGATYDPKDALEGSTYDPKDTLEGSTYDPKDKLEGATYDPKDALEGSPYDPKGALEGATDDPKDALEGSTYDPNDALEGCTYDPKDALEGATDDPKDALEGSTYDPKDALERYTYDPKDKLERPTCEMKDIPEVSTCETKDKLEGSGYTCAAIYRL